MYYFSVEYTVVAGVTGTVVATLLNLIAKVPTDSSVF